MAVANTHSPAPSSDETDLPVVLMVAYSCEPGKGSEPGAGWGMLMAVRQIAHPIVLMRPDSMPAVREWMETDPGPHPEFIVVPESRWVTRARQNRIAAFLVYLTWLKRAGDVARETVGTRQVDLVHHVTYSPYWLPTPIVRLGIPSVVGPVGGAVTTPRPLTGLLGFRGRVTEWIDRWSVLLMERLPATRRTWRAASVQIVQNVETLRRTERFTKQPPILFNHAVFHVVDIPDIAFNEASDDYTVWLSPMESRKGPELAVRAMAITDPSTRLVMVGDGPELGRMKKLASDLGIDDRIEFLGRVDHDRAIELIAGAHAAIFTGLREEGGLALAEALYVGTPTIVLDHGGPSVIAGAAVDPDRVTLIPAHVRKQAIRDLAEAMSQSADRDAASRKPILDRAAVTEGLRDIYTDVLETHASLSTGGIEESQATPTREPQPDDPEISVVMPAYNAEKYIGAAIESVLSQTFTNLELIIVEDGSSDRTWDVIEEYAAKDQRVVAIRNEANLHIVRTINRGVAQARGSLIGRLDADDVALPDRFERQLAVMRAHPEVVVVGSNAFHITADNKVVGLSFAGPTSIEDFRQRRAEGEITMVLDGTSLFRRSVFDLVGGYDPAMDAAQEVDLHSRMASYGVIVAIDEPLIKYRLHAGSSVDVSFFQGREIHRYVTACEQARLVNEPRPTFDEFRAREATAPKWQQARIRLKDTGKFRYRAAGVDISEGQMVSGVTNLATALLVSPRFVVTRLWNRRFSPAARDRMSGVESQQ
jgi:glycosyltransferase involved in cell wall biosynthesis